MTTQAGRLGGGALRSLASLLDDTDSALRRGGSAGVTVWSSGFPALDDTLTGGFRAGELVLLGGPQGNGKTTIGMQFVRNAVAAGRTALFFSYEHEAQTLFERLVSMEAAERIPGEVATVHEVRRALESESGGLTLEDVLAPLPGALPALFALADFGERLHIHESNTSTTLAEIRRIVDEVAQQTGEAPLVLVDYLQKVPIREARDDDAVTAAAEGLKELALQAGVPVVAVAAADKASLGAGRRMRIHDLRGSSALAYESDIVLILSEKVDIVARDHLIYDLGNAQRFSDWCVVTVEKNRHGRAGVELEFHKDFTHGRFHTDGQEVKERLIDERVFVN
ncbi:MAG: AAA family ATPase [Dermatophilaceae bacterium]|nr:AAA family ATPase [Dermatophilaceae bacterium]NUR16385.1 AAA family ATPase [Dermatophilaceae bacterium]NUR79037.1 AAA family ATPase [Dermatophilaceae bacterium]